MSATSVSITTSFNRQLIWFIGVLFVLFQFFLQLSSGVVIGAIMHDLSLSALTAGLLSSAFYIVYAGLQIPAGILFDQKNTRHLLLINILLCSIGCFVFAASYSLSGLFLGRLLIGAGSAFAFVGLSHILRQYYEAKHFAFMMGLSETLGFMVTVMGIMVMGSLVAEWGWRCFINLAGLGGLFISGLCWRYVPDDHYKPASPQRASRQLLLILKNKKAWINGLFVGLCFTVVTTFGALWSVPFIQIKLQCNVQQASFSSAIFFLGTAIGCPMFGWLSAKLTTRRPLILRSCLSTAALLLVLLYIPSQNQTIITLLMFMIGLCCGSYMLAYTIANELAPKGSLSTCTGFTNTLAVITTPLLQPFIGFLLDVFHQTGGYTLHDYQRALVSVPIFLSMACILVFFLPEKKSTTYQRSTDSSVITSCKSN